MPLKFGWVAQERRRSYWINDDALEGVSAQAREAWREDGDARHLEPFVRPGCKPTAIEFRTLSVDEAQYVRGMAADAGGGMRALLTATAAAFRLACDFPDAPLTCDDGSGVQRNRIETVDGRKMLADGFVAALQQSSPGLVMFYGGLIFSASVLTDSEKKASSPRSTATQSGSTTEPQNVTAAEAV